MSKFRLWIQQMWYEHLDELEVIGQRPNSKYTLEDYFNRHKYWLKREFRHQQRNNNI